MAASVREFHVELFEQHLEEASFLYEQRLALLVDPQITWLDLDDFEERFEAHLDALVVGEDLAIEVCKQRCAAGDFGELHAALRVFCRRDRPDLVYAVLQNIDHADEQVVRAVADALKAECPPSWHEDLTRIMLGRCTPILPVLAETLAYRRLPIEDTLLRALTNCKEDDLPRALHALGTIGTERSRGMLPTYLRSENAAVAEMACRAMIRLGDYQAVRHALLVAQLRPWPVIALGIAGDHAAVNVLSDLAKTDKVTDDVLIALGMLGDLRSVSAIFQCLGNEERAMAAAIALQTITGASLYEEVFIPEEIDPDEFFPEEREKYEETGELPKDSDGKPFGSNVTQLSINPETWKAWLTEHSAEFDSKLRYRCGKPQSPEAAIAALADEHTPNRIRALICEELVARYRAPVALETDMPVREQRKHLAALAAWAQSNARKFTPGVPYFAGRPMTEIAGAPR